MLWEYILCPYDKHMSYWAIISNLQSTFYIFKVSLILL